MLACILTFGMLAWRRSWLTMLGMLALLVALSGCVLGRGGGGGSGGGGGTSNPGTTTGNYTVTVIATSLIRKSDCPQDTRNRTAAQPYNCLVSHR